MKKIINIKKHLLEPPIDFCEMLTTKTACGVKLEQIDFPFMQFDDGAVVMFDAYSSAHKCGAFDFDGGVVAFQFCLCCMTDSGERGVLVVVLDVLVQVEIVSRAFREVAEH